MHERVVNKKPLHVRVAEAMGWTKTQQHECPARRYKPKVGICGWPDGVWTGIPAERLVLFPDWQCLIPRYDIDWAVTGPLIEQTQIGLRTWESQGKQGYWAGYHGRAYEASGPGPLIAVCNLILKEAGKL